MCVLMSMCFFFDELIEAFDALLNVLDLFDEGEDEDLVDFEVFWPCAEWYGLADEVESLFNDFGAAASLFVVELSDGGGSGFFEVLECGPFTKKGAGERREGVSADEV